MSQANVNDRSSIERIYPREAFDRDYGVNSRAKAEVMHGVRITSPPAADGSFELVRGSRQVGEIDVESDAVFLFPVMVEAPAMVRQDTGYGEEAERPNAAQRLAGGGSGYDEFVADIIEAAKNAEFKPAIGRREDRLRGFHGG